MEDCNMETINSEQTTLKILSLEDSVNDFEMICARLENEGYDLNIVRVDTESEFTRLLKFNRYDIILADYNLPSFDAFDALKIAKEICPDAPFICISGSIGEILAIELLKQGAVDYVLKDRMERLPSAVKRALDEAREKEENNQVKRSLEKSEEKYRTIFENVQDVFYQTDMKGTICEISPSIKHFSDFAAADLLGKPVQELYYNLQDRNDLLEIILEKGEIRDYEVQLKTKQGKIKYASINARLIYDHAGIPDHIDGAIRDITERKLAQEATLQSEAELNKAQEIGKMGSWIMDLDTFSYKWSKNMLTLLGFNSEDKDIFYEDFFNQVHPADRYLFDLHLEKMHENREEVSFDFRYVRPDGEMIWFQDNILPVFRDGKLVELHGVNLDITEKKSVEKELIKAKENAEASDRLKTSFLNNISHEIRTPLNGILGFGQILTDEHLTQEEKEKYLNILNISSERLINTVNNFIDSSMLASGSQEVSKREFYINSVLIDVIKSCQPICESKNIDLVLNLPVSENNFSIYSEIGLLSKIFEHLVGNAVKFTKQGTITIGFQIVDDHYCFSIKDTGVGISAEMQQTIFRNFMQEEISNNRGYDGCGLGLSIATGLIELLGGRIWLESEKGKGSTFFFTIPT